MVYYRHATAKDEYNEESHAVFIQRGDDIDEIDQLQHEFYR